MENRTNKNSQSNQNPSAQSSSQTNTSNMGSSQSSSSSMNSGSQSSFNQPSSGKNISGSSQSSASGKSNWMDTFKKENLNNLSGKLQEFGNSTMNKVNSLSTTQKVVGGSLLALGAGWVAMNSMNKNKSANLGSRTASAQDKLNRNLNKNKGSNR